MIILTYVQLIIYSVIVEEGQILRSRRKMGKVAKLVQWSYNIPSGTADNTKRRRKL